MPVLKLNVQTKSSNYSAEWILYNIQYDYALVMVNDNCQTTNWGQ